MSLLSQILKAVFTIRGILYFFLISFYLSHASGHPINIEINITAIIIFNSKRNINGIHNTVNQSISVMVAKKNNRS